MLADIEIPSQELYDCMLGNWMTLGRSIPPYEEWSTKVRQSQLESNIESSKCALKVGKMAILDEEDLLKKLAEFPATTRFMDKDIQVKFDGVKNERKD
jgi:hypothetical protein